MKGWLILKLFFPPQLCLPMAVLLKMFCAIGCRELQMSWTGSAGLVPLNPPTRGPWGTTPLAKVTLNLDCRTYRKWFCAVVDYIEYQKYAIVCGEFSVKVGFCYFSRPQVNITGITVKF